MVDVRTVLLGFGIVLGIAMTVLGGFLASRKRKAWVWRAVARGSAAVVLVGIVVGVAVLFFFDTAFQLFHLIFFSQGNFSFDPRTERLTQLFPDRFWTETSIGIAALGLALAVVVTLVARRRAARLAV
jgi:integral membrane protein (TIGR01906 family)